MPHPCRSLGSSARKSNRSSCLWGRERGANKHLTSECAEGADARSGKASLRRGARVSPGGGGGVARVAADGAGAAGAQVGDRGTRPQASALRTLILSRKAKGNPGQHFQPGAP